ncbi:glycosyltransferase family 2 [Apiospora saccharicola]|uniref:Glycosyltransferase family 2 n=1 Tax=Apiospora saccharicola TaxID=335842 RepID=A0ABR1U5Z7_9PEZI
MSLPVAVAILAGLYLYDFYDRKIDAQNEEKYRPFLVPLPHRRRYGPRDVSLVVPTVDTEPTVFVACLETWTRCRPGEIIIVTTESQATGVYELLSSATGINKNTTRVELLTIEKPNKRHQLIKGIQAARGKILALVDDDVRWESAWTLTSLLAPFEEEDIGLVGGPVDSYLPPDRRDPTIVSPWEVAALRLRANRHATMKAAYAADGGINFCVSGVTMLARAAMLRDDPLFRFAFVNERWLGTRQNSGDDTFITRWCLFHHLFDHAARRREMVAQLRKDAAAAPRVTEHGENEHEAQLQELMKVTELDTKRWRLGVQMTEEVTVPTYLKAGPEFVGQMKRWTRSCLRLILTCLLFEPGIIKMYKTAPYMMRKMVERMFSAPLRWLFIACCVLILLYETYNWADNLFGFVGRFPYAAPYWWAAAVVEKVQPVSDFYCWLTLGTEAWETRNTDGDQEGDPRLLVDEIVHGKDD